MNSTIETNDKIIKRLERKIITEENKNFKNKKKTDQQMVKFIKDAIEEEVSCDLNR